MCSAASLSIITTDELSSVHTNCNSVNADGGVDTRMEGQGAFTIESHPCVPSAYT